MSSGEQLVAAPEPMHRWHGFHNVTIAGDSWGDASGPLVVLLHGGGQTRHAWKGTGESLGSAGYFVVALDSRGHGDSDWAPDGLYTPDAMVEDLCCVVKALGGRPAVLVGASMGGATSLIAVGEEHLRTSALVLVDVAPELEPEGVLRIRQFMGKNPEGFDTLDDVADAIADYQPHRKRPRNLDGLSKIVRIGDNGKYRWHWDPRMFDRQTMMEEYQARLARCARNLHVPTLLVRGAMSDLLSEQGAQNFLRQSPNSEYVSVTDAAHMVAGDQNDIFGAALIEFLHRTVPIKGRS